MRSSPIGTNGEASRLSNSEFVPAIAPRIRSKRSMTFRPIIAFESHPSTTQRQLGLNLNLGGLDFVVSYRRSLLLVEDTNQRPGQP